LDTSRYPTPGSLLHLLAALLLIEEDAGCHEDGTADDERLADESRAVAGLGEAAGLGGIRAGEVLWGVCRLLLCDLLCLLSCDLIGKLLLRCDAVGLRRLVGGECRIVAGLEPGGALGLCPKNPAPLAALKSDAITLLRYCVITQFGSHTFTLLRHDTVTQCLRCVSVKGSLPDSHRTPRRSKRGDGLP
jgi:hypothetical protein